MAYTTINKSGDYFNTKLYTGTGATQSITGVGFQPDMTWVKSRTTGGSTNNNHCINDVVRTKGAYGYPMIHPNLNASEYDPTSGNEVITDFQSDGFDLGGNENSNYNTATYASWNWKANGAGSANTDGSISSTVSANTTSGFSIATFTGNGTGSATIGHGLGSAPKFVIIKNRSRAAGESWQTWFDNDKRLNLNSTAVSFISTHPISTSSTLVTTPSTVDSGWNTNNDTYVMYSFAEKKGYSKIGSYTGNGNADGTFVYTGFKPAFVLVKNTQQGGDNWFMWDNKRPGYNQTQKYLSPNSGNAEADSSSYAIDTLSNGFKVRASTGAINNNNETMIYMTFAEAPLVGTNNVPCTAR